jgi:hypothetical protein
MTYRDIYRSFISSDGGQYLTTRQDVDVEVCDLANTIGKLKLKLAPLSFLYSQPIFHHHELQYF